MDIDALDATGVAEAVRAKQVSPTELVELALARIEERNPALNAMVTVCANEARRDAAAMTGDRLNAPFAGVPFVIKDLGLRVKGLPCTNGSRLWLDNVATEDSELVRRYREAGFIIVGTTNSPELGKNASTEPAVHGATHNPHRLGLSPGGSSGGSAAAIASGMVSIGHASDGGGSIRIPASACGLVGLKPSRGRVTSVPESWMLAYPLGINHVLSRSIRDTARALDATAGPMPGDPYMIPEPTTPWAESMAQDPGRLNVAVSLHDRYGEPLHPDTAAAASRLAAILESLGHDVTEAAPVWPNDAFSFITRTVAGVATKLQIDGRLAELGRELRDDDIEPFTRMLYERTSAASGDQVLKALREMERAGRVVGAFWTEYDLLIMPTFADPTPPLGYLDTQSPQAMIERAGRYSVQTSPFNITGQPALSLPVATDATGMPLGVQLIGAFGREDLLLQVGAQVEAATPWTIGPVMPPDESPRGSSDTGC